MIRGFKIKGRREWDGFNNLEKNLYHNIIWTYIKMLTWNKEKYKN